MVKEIIKRVIIICLIILVLGLITNVYMCLSTKKQIVNKVDKNKNYDAIIVLGASIWNGEPSPLLKERLDKGIELYKKGYSKKILMSGDHSIDNHDEVNTMKEYAINKGVPSEDIFMDHAGFSTYESIYRAKVIFRVKKAIIVTQKYHLYRAIYISNALDLKVVGVDSRKNKKTTSKSLNRELREYFARTKDFINSIIKPYPTYLGEEIPITGNGDKTNDKKK